MTGSLDRVTDRLVKAEAQTAALQILCEALLRLADPPALKDAWAQVTARWQVSLLHVGLETGNTQEDEVQLRYMRAALVEMDRLVQRRS